MSEELKPIPFWVAQLGGIVNMVDHEPPEPEEMTDAQMMDRMEKQIRQLAGKAAGRKAALAELRADRLKEREMAAATIANLQVELIQMRLANNRLHQELAIATDRRRRLASLSARLFRRLQDSRLDLAVATTTINHLREKLAGLTPPSPPAPPPADP